MKEVQRARQVSFAVGDMAAGGGLGVWGGGSRRRGLRWMGGFGDGVVCADGVAVRSVGLLAGDGGGVRAPCCTSVGCSWGVFGTSCVVG